MSTYSLMPLIFSLRLWAIPCLLALIALPVMNGLRGQTDAVNSLRHTRTFTLAFALLCVLAIVPSLASAYIFYQTGMWWLSLLCAGVVLGALTFVGPRVDKMWWGLPASVAPTNAAPENALPANAPPA